MEVPAMQSLTAILFKLARASADARAVRRSIETGSLKPLERRARNRYKGRLLRKAGLWGWLWK
jgi:hypothetical protein